MSRAHYSAQKAVARANRGFYRAFERLDLDAMRRVWADDPAIRCIHPGADLLVGPAQVMRSWAVIFAHTRAIRFELVDQTITIGFERVAPGIEVLGPEAGLAWVTNLERIATLEDETWTASQALATNLFALRDGEWRMLLHHASPVSRRFS